MPDNWQAGLNNQDDLSQFPSPSNLLGDQDPAEIRRDPDMLARLGVKGANVGGVPDIGSPEPPEPGGGGGGPQLADKWIGPIQVPGGPAPLPAGDDKDTKPPVDKTPPATPKTAEGYGLAGLETLDRNAQAATKAATDIPTSNPEIADIQKRRDMLATPAPRFDPATGKSLKQTTEQVYDPATNSMKSVSLNPSPSAGQRIWRGVRGGLLGFAQGGAFGALAGAIDPALEPGGQSYGAPSSAYQKAEATRAQQLAATDEQLSNKFKTWKDAVDAAKAKASEFRANAALGKDQVTGATGLITAGNREETEANKTAAKLELDEEEFKKRKQRLQSDPTLAKLSPLNQSLYLANGKLPDPRQPNEADITAAQIARGIVILGHPPQTLEELNKVVSAAKGDLGKGKGAGATPQQSRSINDAKDAHRDRALAEYAKDPYVPPAPGQPEVPGSRDSLLNLQRELQSAQNKYEEDISLLGGDPGPHLVVTVDDKGFEKWTPQVAPVASSATPQPGGPATPSTKTPPEGATHTAKSKKDGKLHWTNEKGTVDYGVAQ